MKQPRTFLQTVALVDRVRELRSDIELLEHSPKREDHTYSKKTQQRMLDNALADCKRELAELERSTR